MATKKKVVEKVGAKVGAVEEKKVGAKVGANIGGVYIWTQRDYNSLMNQLASMQMNVNALMAGVNALSNRTASMVALQTALQTSMQSGQATTQASLTKLSAQEAMQMSALDDLTAAVQQTQNLEQSAVTLIQGLAKQITDAVASNDTAALTDLASKLNTSAAELAAAVTANTTQTPPTPDPNAPQVNPL